MITSNSTFHSTCGSNSSSTLGSVVFIIFQYVCFIECICGLVILAFISKIIVSNGLRHLSPTYIHLLDNVIGDLIYLLSLLISIIIMKIDNTSCLDTFTFQRFLPGSNALNQILDFVNFCTFFHSLFVFTFFAVHR
jgi:hypothetical protein